MIKKGKRNMITDPNSIVDPEIAAINQVYIALKNLDTQAQTRVLTYVSAKLELDTRKVILQDTITDLDEIVKDNPNPETGTSIGETDDIDDNGDLEGISPVAVRWMKRSGLTASNLSKVFSLGIDDIDLVTNSVPGNNRKERMHSVLLLKGIAAYLSSGVARYLYNAAKEACMHYDAFDETNFSKHVKSYAAEISYNKETGFALTPRGIISATEVIKKITDSLEESK
jgi:hypothetical protein